MKAEAMNLLQWQERFSTEEACAEALKQQRWPNGFQRPKCGHGHDHGHWIGSRKGLPMWTLSTPEFSDCRDALPLQ